MTVMTKPILLGPDGKPISSDTYEYAKRGRPKQAKPTMGEAYGRWKGRPELTNLPGLEAIQFNVSKLTISDFRRMSDHYQINSSLLVLSFMLHQLDWKIECKTKSIATLAEENIAALWNRLVRTLCSSFKFGFSPNVLQYENGQKYIEITKIKDLLHEECTPKWKLIEGPKRENEVPEKFKVFDGIEQWGARDIPVENSFWYPLLMEYGDYGGRKLLRTAFQPWFFSSLIHLYQNRYFERFGEPVPIGRAPYDDKIQVGDTLVSGRDLMTGILGMVRNRATVVLPNDKTPTGESSSSSDSYDYTIEYLESQMRGADFERYLTRLDEEMSLALFTPLLLLRTADSGGFNQGVAHTQVYLWMLNAIAEDWKEYIDRYILAPLTIFNFGPRANLPTIRFRKLGTAQQETLRAIVQSLINKDKVMPDVEELGQHIGLDLQEIKDIALPEGEGGNPDDQTDNPDSGNPKGGSPGTGDDSSDTRSGRPEKLKRQSPRGTDSPRATTKQITQRVQEQVVRAYRTSKLNELVPSFGFRKQLAEQLGDQNYADEYLDTLGTVFENMRDQGTAEYKTAEEFGSYFENVALDLLEEFQEA